MSTIKTAQTVISIIKTTVDVAIKIKNEYDKSKKK